jgi:hypothetical protein
VRYEKGGTTSYGTFDGDTIQPIAGDLFGDHRPDGDPVALSDVKLRYPCEPPKVLCVGLNYKSHIGERVTPKVPEIFYKPPTALLDPGDSIRSKTRRTTSSAIPAATMYPTAIGRTGPRATRKTRSGGAPRVQTPSGPWGPRSPSDWITLSPGFSFD